MKINSILFVFLFLLFCLHSFPQNKTEDVSVLFYNVENLFDPQNDSLTNDEDFTPDGDLHWNYNRLSLKLQNISKVILNASGWNPPAIIGLCEIENKDVLTLLLNKTPLSSIGYQIIHKQSPDHRGIDVAFLYDPTLFYPLNYSHYPLLNEKGEVIETREILYVSGILNKCDTIHFFVNHWPSRYSGILETKSIRNIAAHLLAEKVEELNQQFTEPKIIIMGDFNDQPEDESLNIYLNAKEVPTELQSSDLYNLSFDWLKHGKGTLKYQSQWFIFDQIIVSGNLLNTKSCYSTKPENASVLDFPFLLETDEKYGGVKPRRMYVGFKYNKGFSDHLPVLLRLQSAN